MIYDQKINWRDPNKGMEIVSSRHDPFESAVIDYQIEMETAISRLINIHFRNPDAYDVERAPLQVRIQLAQALIGPTPDDDVWDIVKAFSRLRNSLIEGSFQNMVPGAEPKRQLLQPPVDFALDSPHRFAHRHTVEKLCELSHISTR